MKKKISVFALLLSLMLAVLVPVQAKAANSTETTADDVKYRDIEDFMCSHGYTDFSAVEGAIYIVFANSDVYQVFEYQGISDYAPYVCYSPNVSGYPNCEIWVMSDVSVDSVKYYTYYSPARASEYDQYTCVSETVWTYTQKVTFKNNKVTGFFSNKGFSSWSCFASVIYSDVDIYSQNVSKEVFLRDVNELLFETSVEGLYSFPSWCADAGLNCLASANESPTKIPYSYNSYWHIVRKTSSGKWLLTTIGNSKNQEGMQLRLSEDNSKLIVYNDYEDDGTDSSGNGYLANVRQYEYDTDGWKVRTYETLDFTDTEEVTIELEAGTGLDDTRILAFTNTDIYSFNGYAILHEASTEYYEVTDTPTVTPEPTPGSGSSGSGDSDDTGSDDSGSSGSGSSGGGRPGTGTRPSVGGEASGGGGLDFIINLFTLIWTKICAVPMAVDGYSISLQQIFVYGALVSIVGGFIIKFIFRR